MTLAVFRTDTRYHLDDSNSANYRFSTALVDSFINKSYRYYYMKAVNAKYQGLLTTPTTLNIVAGTATIALPNNFLQAWKVSRVIDNTRVPLIQKHNYENTTYTSGGLGIGQFYPNYDFQGTNLVLDPTPVTSITGGIYLEYWPVSTAMVNASDDVAAGFKSDWTDMIPLRAALWIKGTKEEEDIGDIANLLREAEMPFNKAIGRMSSARRRTERFIA